MARRYDRATAMPVPPAMNKMEGKVYSVDVEMGAPYGPSTRTRRVRGTEVEDERESDRLVEGGSARVRRREVMPS